MLMIPRHFRKTVTTAGTRERVHVGNLVTPTLDIQAESDNTGRVFIGDSQVSSTNCMATLGPGDSLSLVAAQYGGAGAQFNLSDFWIDVGTSTDGAFFSAPQRKEDE